MSSAGWPTCQNFRHLEDARYRGPAAACCFCGSTFAGRLISGAMAAVGIGRTVPPPPPGRAGHQATVKKILTQPFWCCFRITLGLAGVRAP